MRTASENRAALSGVFQNTLDACIGLLGGQVAERMLLAGEPSLASDDRRQAMELACLLCKSPQAIEKFLSFCEQQAYDPSWRCRSLPIVMDLRCSRGSA